jgi:site-specific DNA-methyltransferase (adenine-specific)
MSERVVIGNAELWHGDCREVLPTLQPVDAVITDPPYSERTHAGHDATARGHKGSGNDGAARAGLGYQAMTPEAADWFAAEYARLCLGWVVWMTDHTLAPDIAKSLQNRGRYVFAPLPFFAPGSRVRLSGDGPSSWTDWIVVSRTAAQSRWGTLPGGYMSGPGWSDKARMGGKPTLLMNALVSDYSRPGDLVLDSHMGAGTTGVACAQTGRRFIGCEIEREAFDIACERISRAQAQGQMFAPEPVKQEQESLL